LSVLSNINIIPDFWFR